MKLLLLMGVLMSTLSFANEKGNGGGVHYCSDDNIQMYDLYEGYNRYNLIPYENASYSMEDYIDRAMNKVKNKNLHIYFALKKEIENIQNGKILRRSRINLNIIHDANLLFVDQGCEYKQLANWDDLSGNIIVQDDLFKLLSELDKAALYMHEALYYLSREKLYDKNSDKSRYLVADAMSDKKELGQDSELTKLWYYGYHPNLSRRTFVNVQPFEDAFDSSIIGFLETMTIENNFTLKQQRTYVEVRKVKNPFLFYFDDVEFTQFSTLNLVYTDDLTVEFTEANKNKEVYSRVVFDEKLISDIQRKSNVLKNEISSAILNTRNWRREYGVKRNGDNESLRRGVIYSCSARLNTEKCKQLNLLEQSLRTIERLSKKVNVFSDVRNTKENLLCNESEALKIIPYTHEVIFETKGVVKTRKEIILTKGECVRVNIYIQQLKTQIN